jgi:hypothetical protein
MDRFVPRDDGRGMDRFVPRDDGKREVPSLSSLRAKRGNPWIASFLAMTGGMDRFVPRDDG